MQDVHELSPDEQKWLLTLSRTPMVRPVAETSVPDQVRDSLIRKQLLTWKAGFLDVTLLEATPEGVMKSQYLQAAG
jgi:hypothetical protein